MSEDTETLGQRAADLASKHIGSWSFLIGFNLFVAVWCFINVMLGRSAFDPYPYILLNLVFSWLAGVQAPVIMISQNRQEEVQRRLVEDIYRISQAALLVVEGQRDMLSDHADLLRALRESDERILKVLSKEKSDGMA